MIKKDGHPLTLPVADTALQSAIRQTTEKTNAIVRRTKELSKELERGRVPDVVKELERRSGR